MNFVRNWMLVMALIAGAAQASAEQLKGIDPWPFPWAKECPVNWEALNGYYTLSESNGNGEVTMRISVEDKGTLRLMRVIRYSSGNEGAWMYSGEIYISKKQKLIRLYLDPVNGKGGPIWAAIKLHYMSEVRQCSVDYLVPIVSMQRPDHTYEDYDDYKMNRVGD